MMRGLFYLGTGIFWLGVAIFWATSADEAASRPPTLQASGTFPLAEIGRHAVAEDCWMAIDGQVYDLTAYLPEHPSRPSIILPWCGREATEAYRTKSKGRAHSPAADAMLSEYRIGRLGQ